MSGKRKCAKWRKVFGVFAVMVLGAAVFAPAAHAASTLINFDPTGNAGTTSQTLNVSSWQFDAGNVLAIGGGNLTSASIGSNFPVLYEAILGTINTSGGGNTAGTAVSNTGAISVNGVNTNQQVVITAQFTETLTGFSNGVATFAPNLGVGTDAVKIYAQLANNANSASLNSSSGVGFQPQAAPPGSTLILSGTVTGQNFTSSFTENTSTDPRFGGTPVLLNQHVGGSGSYPTTNTIVGTGNTGLTVAVNSVNSSYFLSSTPFFQLNFTSISSGTPFQAVDPLTTMFTGATPNLGSVNGTGSDFLFQSQATTAFSVPEPSSIVLGTISIGFVSVASVWKRRRRNASTTA